VTSGTVSARGAAAAEPLPPAAATAATEPATGALRVSSRFRLRGAAYKAALTAHILAAAAWFGIAVVVAFCGIAAAIALAVFKPRVRTPWGRRRTATGGGR
jgi:hypothetical protein